MATAKLWMYYDSGGNQQGPVQESALASMLQRAELPMTTMLWAEGMPGWVAASEIAEFAAIHPVTSGDLDEQGPVWYYLTHDRQRKGPVSADGLAKLFVVGVLDGLSLVWHPKLGNWASLTEVPSLKAAIAEQEARSAAVTTSAEADGVAALTGAASRHRRPAGGETAVTSPADRISATRAADVATAGAGGVPAASRSAHPTAAESARQPAAAGAADAPRGMDGGTAKAESAAKRRRPKKRGRKKDSSKWVYVSGLPADVTVDEVAEMFGKYGVLQDDTETGKPRVKLYRDGEGRPKVGGRRWRSGRPGLGRRPLCPPHASTRARHPGRRVGGLSTG